MADTLTELQAQSGCSHVFETIAMAEIDYLMETGRIDHITLAGIPMISLDGIRAYLTRHAEVSVGPVLA